MTKRDRILSLLLACIGCCHSALSADQFSQSENVTLESALAETPPTRPVYHTIKTNGEMIDVVLKFEEAERNGFYSTEHSDTFGKGLSSSTVHDFVNGSTKLDENTAEWKHEPAFLRLPGSSQSFRATRISKKNYVFVDKTNYIGELIDNDEIETEHKIYFLARPRTFGKSYFLSMLKEFLTGSKTLFNNTRIASRGNKFEGNGDWMEHPVIYLDFSTVSIKSVRGFKDDVYLRL